jgi:hypothetical protein
MNERFYLPQYITFWKMKFWKMFAMHPFPPTTPRICHHLYEVNTSAIREISNHHSILLCARRWTRIDDVNLSIPWWRNLSRCQNNSLQSLSNLPPICLLCWKLEHCCLLNIVMSIVQECYNNHFFTCLAHSNPSNKIEYVWWQWEPPTT